MMETNQAQKWSLAKSSKRLSVFIKEIASNPSAVGAACPSSKKLAENIAAHIPLQSKVVELGAGTGAITASLLNHGVLPQNLTIIERSPSMVKLLQERFPDFSIIQGDAQHLEQILSNKELPVDVIVSGLPLRSLPKTIVSQIGEQIEHVLKKEGLFIQFTYALHRASAPPSNHFHLIKTQYTWWNFPPARVEVFRYDG